MIEKYLVSYQKYYPKFKELFDLYTEWNSKINISSINDEKEVIIKHFEDSLFGNDVINIDGKKVLDIGTGGGFPLLPLAITNPNVLFTGLDAVNKKLTVIKSIADSLGLKNVKIIHGRAEEIALNNTFREQFDIVTARAFSKWSSMLEMSLPFVKVGGFLLAYQTSNIVDEIEQKKLVLEKLGGKFERNFEFKLSENMGERLIILIKKIKNTPSNFPRPVGIPKEKPL